VALSCLLERAISEVEMTYQSDKRAREIRKKQKQEKKAERKRLRKMGLLGTENPPASSDTPAAPAEPASEQPKADPGPTP
jgi:hypothetical protein